MHSKIPQMAYEISPISSGAWSFKNKMFQMCGQITNRSTRTFCHSVIPMIAVIKSPRFLVRLRRRHSAHTFQLPGKTPEANFFKPHMVDLWVWEFFWHPSRWPWVKVIKLPKRDAIYLVPTVKWERLIQSLHNLVGICPSSCFLPD